MEYCDLGDLSLFIKKKGAIGGNISLAGPWGGIEEFALRYLIGQLGILW
jgi:hypothetical protein